MKVLKTSEYLQKKGTKINLGKYHMAVRELKNDLPKYSTKGCLLGFVCHVFNYKMQVSKPVSVSATKKAEAPSLPASSSDLAPPPAAPAEEPPRLEAAPRGDRPTGRLTLRQVQFAGERLTEKCVNQVHTAATTYGNIQNLYNQTLVADVAAHTAAFAGQTAQQIRSCKDSVAWETRMCKGDYSYHMRLTIFQTQATKRYPTYGIESEWSAMRISKDHVRVGLADDAASLLWRLCFATARFEGIKWLPVSHGYPRRYTLLLDDGEREGIITQLMRDVREDEIANDIDVEALDGMKTRSLFLRRTVQQVVLCLKIEDLKWTLRLERLVTGRQTRFLTCRIADDSFNRIKASVDHQGHNTTCSMARSMAVIVDKGVIGKIHRFEEINRHDEILERSVKLSKETWKPELNPKKMDPKLAECKFNTVISTGEAPWFSPNSENVYLPIVDVLTRRANVGRGRGHLMGDTWLSHIALPNLMLRRKGTVQWSFGNACACGAIGVGWPAVRCVQRGVELWYPDTGEKAETTWLSIVDPSEWEGMAFEVWGPMRICCELTAPKALPHEEIHLPSKETFGKQPVAGFAITGVLDLFVAAAWLCFGTLPRTWLYKLLDYLGLNDGVDTSQLINILIALITHFIKKITQEQIDEILLLRIRAFEAEDYSNYYH